MRIVFFGTPEVAAVSLRALIDSSFEVVGVVTQPDRPKGRSGEPVAPPTKVIALENALHVLQPESPKEPSFAEELSALNPDCCAVVAYGHLLPREVLRVPAKGTINAHFSLLPRYRGAAPVQRAIMAGETKTGVSVFLLEPTLDTGPVIEQVEMPIEEQDTTGTLLERLANLGAASLLRALASIEDGSYVAIPQDDSLASPAPKIRPEEAHIDWNSPASDIRNLIRAMNPSPGAFTSHADRRLKVWSADVVSGSYEPGTIAKDLSIGTSKGALALREVQPEAKRRMLFEEYARGARISPGDRLT
ncbi:MAG: methionyl-tRNA formyltransferase [Actinomycetota bacterium]